MRGDVALLWDATGFATFDARTLQDVDDDRALLTALGAHRRGASVRPVEAALADALHRAGQPALPWDRDGDGSRQEPDAVVKIRCWGSDVLVAAAAEPTGLGLDCIGVVPGWRGFLVVVPGRASSPCLLCAARRHAATQPHLASWVRSRPDRVVLDTLGQLDAASTSWIDAAAREIRAGLGSRAGVVLWMAPDTEVHPVTPLPFPDCPARTRPSLTHDRVGGLPHSDPVCGVVTDLETQTLDSGLVQVVARCAAPVAPDGEPRAERAETTRGIDPDERVARAKALAEAWERYALHAERLDARGADHRRHGPDTSSGIAAYPDLAGATERAVRELVERDALMVSWAHQQPAMRTLTEVQDLAAAVPLADDWEVGAWLLSSGAEVPVALVVARSRPGCAPRLVWGAAADVSVDAALRHALVEATGNVCAPPPPPGRRLSADEVATIDDHEDYYRAADRLHAFDYLDAPRQTPSAGDLTEHGSVVEACRAKGVSIRVDDITPPEARAAGLTVARAASPDLVPLWFGHDDTPLDHPRLRGATFPLPPHPFA